MKTVKMRVTLTTHTLEKALGLEIQRKTSSYPPVQLELQLNICGQIT